MVLYICLTFLCFFGKLLQAERCDQNGEVKCCSGYKWNNRTRHCEKCSPGYTGPECAYSCIYPYYGEDCFKECDCQIKLCDHQLGCNTSFTGSTIAHINQSTVNLHLPTLGNREEIFSENSQHKEMTSLGVFNKAGYLHNSRRLERYFITPSDETAYGPCLFPRGKIIEFKSFLQNHWDIFKPTRHK
ncbi:uncharacterized protein LOC111102978 isoform X1 [Crassostrea virginica]